jgi:hypothetical protein
MTLRTLRNGEMLQEGDLIFEKDGVTPKKGNETVGGLHGKIIGQLFGDWDYHVFKREELTPNEQMFEDWKKGE